MAFKAPLKNCMQISVTIFTLLAQVAVFLSCCYVIAKLYTCGTEKENTNGFPFAQYEIDWFVYFLMFLYVFGTYWLMLVINNFNDFLTAAITANFYYKTMLPNWRVFFHTLNNNIGSIAYSIVLLPVMILKVPIGWLDWKIDTKNPNCLQKCLKVMFAPCFWCYDKVLDRVDSNYEAMTYMSSEGLCKSSNRLYYLNAKYMDKTSTLRLVSRFYDMLAKTFLAFVGTLIFYVAYKLNIKYQQNITNVLLLFVVCIFACYIIGAMFINLFSTTFDTILVCFQIELNVHENYGTEVKNCPQELLDSINNIQAIGEGHTNYRLLN